MATTAQWVFEKTMALMDELNESTGSADTSDTREYKNRTLSILNVLQWECFPASDTYRVARPGKRPAPEPLEGLDQEIGLDDGICRSVLPYGLAAHLLVEENPDAAAFFHERYGELLGAMRQSLPGVVEEIDDLYGGVGLGASGRW